MLNHELEMPLRKAAQVADLVLQADTSAHRLRVAATSDGAIALRIDLERFHSTTNASLAAAFAFGERRSRGRPRKPLRRPSFPEVFREIWEIRVERDAATLERLANQLRAWNAYPRGIEPGRPFIMDAVTLRSLPRLAFSTNKGEIDVVLAGVPDAKDGQPT